MGQLGRVEDGREDGRLKGLLVEIKSIIRAPQQASPNLQEMSDFPAIPTTRTGAFEASSCHSEDEVSRN